MGAYLGRPYPRGAGIYIAPSSHDSHFTHPTLAHFTMAPPPVELDPQLAEIEELDAAELAATIAAFERQKLEEVEIEEWEAAGLVAMEEFERTQRKQSRREREHHELQREEMQKRLRVEQQLRQEAATTKAAANARKD